MPIKRLQRETAQFPCIGQLRKGDVKPSSGKAPGKDLEHFRFTTDDEHAAKLFESAFGKEPDTINVYLPFPTTDENFSAWQEHWVSGGLKHRCDGENCVLWLDESTGQYCQDPKPCPGGCSEVGRLMVIIPALQRFAYVTVLTSSVHDIITLTENLQAVEAVAGKLDGIPFILKRRPKEISTPSGTNGGRARRTKWLLSIEVDPAWAAVRFVAMQRAALAQKIDDSHLLSVEDDEDYIDADTITIADAPDDPAASMASPQPQPEPATKKPAQSKPPTFKNVQEALGWAVGVGAYTDETVGDAYAAIKAELKPGSAGEMWAAWIEHVTPLIQQVPA